MNFPILISRKSSFPILGVLVLFVIIKANSGDPDQTPRSAASDLGLHGLSMSRKKDARLIRLIWVKSRL